MIVMMIKLGDNSIIANGTKIIDVIMMMIRLG
jgi:hypothetical protein